VKVREIMDRRTCQISSSAMIGEAADRMKALGTDVLPVVENRRVIGTITEHSIASQIVSRGMDPATTTVRAATTSNIVCCSQETDIEDAALLMEAGHVAQLIVLDAEGGVAGVLSGDDLALKVGVQSHNARRMSNE